MNDTDRDAGTDGDREVDKVIHKSRLVKVLQFCLWLTLPLLVFLYLLYAVAQQEGPAYKLVSGTPVERYCLKLIPYLWRHLSFLERQSMDASLSEMERRNVRMLLERMETIRPTHNIQLKSGNMLFGRPVEESNEEYGFRQYNGKNWKVTTVLKSDIGKMQPITFQHEEFSTRNLRFLLSTDGLNHYYLHPYLFATPTEFKSALRQHAHLSQLESQFRTAFGPLISEDKPLINHVRNLPNEMALAEVAGRSGEFSTVNAAAFYKRSESTLYLVVSLVDDAELEPEREWLIRHEGAHHLVESLGLFAKDALLPFWIVEGLSQYCERQPMAAPHPDKLDYLRELTASGKLIPWATLLKAPLAPEMERSEDELKMLYAQSWVLFHILMQKKNRPGFLGFLAKLTTFEQDWMERQPILIGNHVGKTWVQLESELARAIDVASHTAVEKPCSSERDHD